LARRVLFLHSEPDLLCSSSSYVLVTQPARQLEESSVAIDR
jgi:hypothetical protein